MTYKPELMMTGAALMERSNNLTYAEIRDMFRRMNALSIVRDPTANAIVKSLGVRWKDANDAKIGVINFDSHLFIHAGIMLAPQINMWRGVDEENSHYVIEVGELWLLMMADGKSFIYAQMNFELPHELWLKWVYLKQWIEEVDCEPIS